MFSTEVAIVHGVNGPALVLSDVPSIEDPRPAKSGESFLNIPAKLGVTPRATGIIDANRFVDLDLPVVATGGR
jgi:hypothetical protein